MHSERKWKSTLHQANIPGLDDQNIISRFCKDSNTDAIETEAFVVP